MADKKNYGSCNAIFSTYPIFFNKENNPPAKMLHGKSSQELDKIAMDKSKLNKKKSTSVETVTPKKTDLSSQGRINSSPALSRSKSAMALKQEKLKKASSDDKLKTPKSRGYHMPTEKSPVTHFCTGKPPSMKTDGTPFRTPSKKYISEHSLMQSTPDCFGSVQFETPRGKSDVATDEPTLYEGETSNLTVGIRVRPMNSKELSDPKVMSIVKVRGTNVTVDCDASQHTFVYDHCFVSYANTARTNHASQETVFNSMVSPLVQNAFEGYNVCLFAYGQTGSGKSYSMMGESTLSNDLEPSEDAGIIPRFCYELFSLAARNKNYAPSIEISYFEIYNEKIHDLLATNSTNNGNKRAPLKVREHPVFGPYVVDLSQHTVQSYEDLQTWLKVGNSQRATAATGMNEKSSRSHSIFSIIMTQGQKSESSSVSRSAESSRRSKINLVDLAGSERLSQTCASGDRLREGVSINKSLLILGKVIASLAENTSNRKRGFVPYRESVLTWLLKESLGGNSKTAMLATVSPSSTHLEETLATLRYACQARSIVNRVRINEDPHDKLIRQLKAEVLRLRGVRENYERQLGPRRLIENGDSGNDNLEIQKKQLEIQQLRDQLKRTEEQLASNQKSWKEKLQEAEERKKSEINYLRHCGIAIELDYKEIKSTPCLVNLAADPMLSGTLLYLIPAGKVRIGRQGKQIDSMDIVLDGPLVAPFHCTIENNKGILSLMPESNGDTYVNGQLVCDKVCLKHGDRLVIGGNHYFKVCNSNDENSNAQANGQPIDYEYAHQEILAIQEEKLRAELEESKRKAVKELENAKKEVEMQLGSQKTSYEREIKMLGMTLEQQKLALEEVNKKKRQLEVEKEMLTYQIQENKTREVKESMINVEPYESNFLQELEKILNEATADAEIALTIAASNEVIAEGGITLHEMQLLVREATQRCRDIGINYEFSQSRVISEKGLQPVIRIRDRDRMLETLWQPENFLDWVRRLRDFDNEDTIKELIDNDGTSWEMFDESEMPEDSLDTSRISVNLTPVKKQLNESLHQLSMNGSFLDGTIDKTTDSVVQRRYDDMDACLLQIEVAAKTLGKLCHQYESRETSGEVTKSLDKVRNVVSALRETLNSSHKTSDSTNIESSISTVIENSVTSVNQSKNDHENDHQNQSKKTDDKIISSPNKSFRACPFLQDNNSKSVRFNVK
ncbi:kinesin-like protein KIF14 [Microplitis mediator]|uniref:kinesin-like protein KIF14 n=1 Tax=Microplitis mediator TaxID=375433 RepID=UPI0025530536|nr:kinesin-like protein KIF14 [Microplitis mediator]